MRGARTVEVGLIVAVMLALLPVACYAESNRMLPTEAGIGGGGRVPRAPAAAAVQVPPPAPSNLQDALRQALTGESPIPQGPVHYTVQRGDGLWRIARYFGLSVAILASVNGFDGSKVLREGMDLVIPWSNVAGTARHGVDAPVVEAPGLHFVASIASQTCWLFQDSEIVASWVCSTGRPGSPSIPGNYTVQTKEPRAYNTPAAFWMPFWLGVYDAGIYENGIHGVPYSMESGESRWQDLVGTPITYGCIMLDDTTAEALYRLAYIGMPVTILP